MEAKCIFTPCCKKIVVIKSDGESQYYIVIPRIMCPDGSYGSEE